MASLNRSVQDSPARRIMEPDIKQAVLLLDDALNSPTKSTLRLSRNTPGKSGISRRKRDSLVEHSVTHLGESLLRSSRLVDTSMNYDSPELMEFGNADVSASFVAAREPWSNVVDELFVDFQQSLQTHKSEHQIFETVRDFIENCSNVLQLLADIGHKISGKSKVLEKMKWLINERETWRLIYALYKDRLSNQDEMEQGGDRTQAITSHVLSEKEVVQELYKNDCSIRESQLVVDWLEQNALHCEEDQIRMQHYTDKTVAWENTLHQIQNESLNISYSSSRPVLNKLDPDAPLRERKPLHDLDMEDEEKLIKGVFREIRYGRLEEAQNLCFHCGQPWRAATLEGWRLFHDPNYADLSNSSGEKLPVEGNPNRDLWKLMAWNLASDTRLPLYARATHAVFCGHLNALEGVCETWTDLLWAFLKVMIDVRVEKEIRATVLRSYVPLPDEYWQNKLTLPEIFTKIAASKKAAISEGAANPDHIVQTCIILNDIPHLMAKMLEWVPSADAQFLRFMAHLVLFYRSCGFAEIDEVGDSILEAYVKVLMKKGDPQLVACYVATLPQEDQVKLYANFLENITEENERTACLTAAEDAGLDIEVITKRVVENIRNRENVDQPSDLQMEATPEDLIKVSALNWLIFYPSQRAEALFQANAMIRQFLALGRMEAARKAFSKIPVDSIDITVQEFQRGMPYEACQQFDMDSLPYRIASSIREYFCHKAYLDAQEGFSDWFHHFHSAKPIPPAEPAGEVGFTEKVLFDHKRTQYNMELERWKLSMQQQTKMVKIQLHNVLLFPDGGWLVDIHSKDGPLEEEFDDEAKCRLQQMENLRKICIPKIVLLLISMMQSMGDHAECIQLAETIVSEQHQIYKVYTPQKMRELLKKIAESSLELMKNKRDPWGHPITF
ncbi:hypothetical protein R5R35_008705 [Gryllus longicercus]|uniref:Nuclear pore complex protein n=1 Tax=Gryllus longicercus TaxID=2509291 RepID=A0AAN9YZ36_9ORTH